MHVVIVAGEASGDILGAGLIQQLKTYRSDIEFFGIGGPLMCAQGFESLCPMDRLSVMGFVEPLKRLPELLRLRKKIISVTLTKQADLFIGIDSPDFNLGIESTLKKHGIKTCHYVSPSVWAWRQGRIKKIKKAVDLMLTLLPFEADFYQQHRVPVAFVGHPLADQIPFETDQFSARKALDIEQKAVVIGLLPGSRSGEVNLMAPLFLDVAAKLSAFHGALHFVIPAANEQRMQQLQFFLSGMDPSIQSKITLCLGRSRELMAASDIILLASGTTALEAMLLKKPMVVAYKLAPISYAIVSRLIRCDYVSLPNLLANKAVVNEYLQNEASVENLVSELTALIENEVLREQQVSAFKSLHRDIQCQADEKAAKAIWKLINE